MWQMEWKARIVNIHEAKNLKKENNNNNNNNINKKNSIKINIEFYLSYEAKMIN